MPVKRLSIFDPPEDLGRLRDSCPLSRMRFGDGHVGWLVTSYVPTIELIDHADVSVRNELHHSRVTASVMEHKPSPPGWWVRMDEPDHSRYKGPLVKHFSVPRVRSIEDEIRSETDRLVTGLTSLSPPVDLVESFAVPLAASVLCRVLGFSVKDSRWLVNTSRTLLGLTAARDHLLRARADIAAYILDTVERSRSHPDPESVIGALCSEGEMTNEEISNMVFPMLVTGLESTPNMISLGTFALLMHPEQLELYMDDPSYQRNGVEELVRYLSIFHFGVQRAAVADIRMDGVTIRSGESIVLSIPAANRDPVKFHQPDVLDITRNTSGHLGFGWGSKMCLGRGLARVQLMHAFSALFSRFPRLRLAVPPGEVPMRHDSSIYGVHSLLVTW